MYKTKLFILIVLVFAYSSCEKSNNNGPDDPIVNDTIINNTAILEGSLIGDNSESLEDLWKSSRLVIEETSEFFHTDSVYISRSSTSSDYIYWIVPVTNIADEVFGFVKATGIELLDGDNNVIYWTAQDEISYVNGTCGGLAGSKILTSTLLKPNETGYFKGIKQANYESVASIRFRAIEKSDREYHPSDIQVIPTGYQIYNTYEIHVSVKNMSDETAYVIFSPYIMLSSNNIPLHWSYIDPYSDAYAIEKAVGPGTTELFYDLNLYNGSCNRIKPILDFNLEPIDDLNYSATNMKRSLSSEELQRCLLLQRNRMIQKIDTAK